MEKRAQKHRYRWRWLTLLPLAILLLLIGGTKQERANLSWPEQALREVARPLQSGVAWLGQQISRLPLYFNGVQELQEQYAALQQENASLRYQVSQNQGLRYQNLQLQQLLELAESIPAWQPVAASVISRSQTTWRQSLFIDKGSADGLHSGLAVLSAQGLVGRINQTTPHTAEVLLLTGPASAVAAVVAESRWAGVIEADSQNPGGLVLTHLPLLAECQPGEAVISSGLGGVYPYGLPIGVVSTAPSQENGLSQQLQIEPYADFDRLEQVLVLQTEDATGAYDLPLESLLPGTEPEVPAFAPLPPETTDQEQSLPQSIQAPGQTPTKPSDETSAHNEQNEETGEILPSDNGLPPDETTITRLWRPPTDEEEF